MDLFLVYLWLKLDMVVGTFKLMYLVSIVFSAILGVIFLMTYTDECVSTESRNRLKEFIKKVLLILAVSGTFVTVIPTSKDVAILVGVHYVNKAIETPEAAKVQTLLRLKANEMLDKHIQEATKAASDSKN